MPFIVAIIGRPNVGKSTLFNRLMRKHTAIVADTPGVTRDRREGDTLIGDRLFRLVDTAGLDDADQRQIEGRMRLQTESAVNNANLVLFLIDARAGLTPLDSHFAAWLRTRHCPVLLLANKCEGSAGEPGRLESYTLGLGDPIAVSAQHGQGLTELCDKLVEIEKTIYRYEDDVMLPEVVQQHSERPLSLAIVGRPNVGKSTLVNQLLGEKRMLTGPEAGITRDAISNKWAWKDRTIKLIDTAGIRRHAKFAAKLEWLSVQHSLRAVQYAEVVALIIDANAILEKQDLTIARNVIEEGRALIIAVNKWDLAENKKQSLNQLSNRLKSSLPQVKGIPVITCSAKTGQGMKRFMPAIFDVYNIWNARVPTGELNRWFEMMLEAHPPPAIAGRRLRPRYITQVKTRPPTFSIFSNRAENIPEAYLRYLANGLREDFGLSGVPLRLNARSRSNPYVSKRK